MRKRKYSLPRHTIIAKDGKRVMSFFIDLALFFAGVLAFSYGCFGLILKGKTEPLKKELDQEQLNSGLYIKNEKGKNVRPSGRETSVEEFVDILKYYYFNYLGNHDLKDGLEGCKEVRNYDVEWFNKEVLEIPDNPDSPTYFGYFTYQKVDGVYDKTLIGVEKDPSNLDQHEETSSFIQRQYKYALQIDFLNIDYIDKMGVKYLFYCTLEVVLAAVVSSFVVYIVLPLILKNGQTVGKKVNGLGLASIDGYKINNKQLIMRFIPLLVVILAFLIPIGIDPVMLYLVPIIVFLVSFAIFMASPKRCSLHDFCARTIVVDLKSSILFENEIEEEAYIAKEDNLTEIAVERGEEPDISYEK